MIDKSKQYKTRDGREVRIYATDGGGHMPIHGAIREGDNWIACCWLYSGTAALDCNSIIEVKPRIQRTVWVNVYPHGANGYSSREGADDFAYDCRIACVKLTIDCEEGEGL